MYKGRLLKAKYAPDIICHDKIIVKLNIGRNYS